MTKNELLTRLSGRLACSKDEADFIIQIFGDIVNEGLKSDKRVSTPYGVFKLVKRKAKRFRNIATGEIDVAPERYEVRFEPHNKDEFKKVDE